MRYHPVFSTQFFAAQFFPRSCSITIRRQNPFNIPDEDIALLYYIRHSIVLTFLALFSTQIYAETWTVPVAGNTFRTTPGPGGRAIKRNQTLSWNDGNDIHSVFFHVDRAAKLTLSLTAENEASQSTLEIRIGDKRFQSQISGQMTEYELGHVEMIDAGYVKVDLKGVGRRGKDFGMIQSLIVASDTKELAVDFVRNNEGNMYYWGRRGPSVHLSYHVPKNVDLRYAYSEITVPVGEDPIGSYFMANGFSQGYFGIQVNSATERRVLFSVWSPFKTDNPREVPKDQRIETLRQGNDVHVGKFGNEGSGGQSYLVYPWKAGNTYRFLTKVEPDENGSTVYTSWFGDKSDDEWRLIASFRRPKTDTHLTGFHSFLESFDPSRGHIGRRAHFGNVWVRDVSGKWYECTKAKFSVDATGGNRHRLDFNGGAEGKSFYLRNCGFFSGSATPGTVFERAPSEIDQPKVLMEGLPSS